MRIGCYFLAGLALLAVAASQFYSSSELKVGQSAPNFELPGSDGQSYRLDQFRGKQAVVLAWFPKAHTGVCRAECKSLRDSAAALQKFDVAVFAASCDKVESNRKFAEDLQIAYPILSDPTGQTARAYGVLKGLPWPARHTIYVSKDGNVLLVDRNIRAASAGQDMLKHLEELGVEPRP